MRSHLLVKSVLLALLILVRLPVHAADLSVHGPKAPAKKLVPVGDVLWLGKPYRGAFATTHGVDFIEIRSVRDGIVRIPRAEAPASIRGALAPDNNAVTTKAFDAREAAVAEWRRKNSAFHLTGEITALFSKGTMVRREGSSELYWLRAKWPGGAVGDSIRVEVKRDGHYTYQTTRGVSSTVSAVVACPIPPKLLAR